MPPPYPEAYRESAAVRSRKRAVNSMVIALSYLHLRGSRQAPEEMLAGRRLNSRQRFVVKRLEKMLEAWLITHQLLLKAWS